MQLFCKLSFNGMERDTDRFLEVIEHRHGAFSFSRILSYI